MRRRIRSGTNTLDVAYDLMAEWTGGDRKVVVQQLADMPRFDAVLAVVEMLDWLPSVTRDSESRQELLNALEEAARRRRSSSPL